MRRLLKWLNANLAVSLAISAYLIVQVLVFSDIIDPKKNLQYIPMLFTIILIVISIGINSIREDIDSIQDTINSGRVEMYDTLSDFFNKLTRLINEDSNVEIYYQSAKPLSIFREPCVVDYENKVDGFVKDKNSKIFVRRLVVLHSRNNIEWMCDIYDKYKDCYGYQIRYMDFYELRDIGGLSTFTGFITIDNKYCFLVLPREFGGRIQVVLITCKDSVRVLSNRFDVIWSSALEVNEETRSFLLAKWVDAT